MKIIPVEGRMEMGFWIDHEVGRKVSMCHGRWRTSVSRKRDKPMEVSRSVDSMVVRKGTWNA